MRLRICHFICATNKIRCWRISVFYRAPFITQHKQFNEKNLNSRTFFNNSHTRSVARKFSIGGFAVLRGGLEIIKLTKTPHVYSVSRFNLGGLGALIGVLSPPNPPWRRDCLTHSHTTLKNSHIFQSISDMKIFPERFRGPRRLLKAVNLLLSAFSGFCHREFVYDTGSVYFTRKFMLYAL